MAAELTRSQLYFEVFPKKTDLLSFLTKTGNQCGILVKPLRIICKTLAFFCVHSLMRGVI